MTTDKRPKDGTTMKTHTDYDYSDLVQEASVARKAFTRGLAERGLGKVRRGFKIRVTDHGASLVLWAENGEDSYAVPL